MALVPQPLIAALALLAAPAAKPPETAADVVTLRDGKVVLGQVIDPAPRGALRVLVRRAWAVAELPGWADRWQKAETAGLARARSQRRARLAAWRKERASTAKADDPILAWIDAEQKRLDDPAESSSSKLMDVKLSRNDVRSVVRRPKGSARMLRQAWLTGFAGAESLPLAELRDALEGRGFAPEGRTPVPVDSLLPVTEETEAQWSARRAATEVANDPGLKFLRTGAVVLPEPDPGKPPELAGALGAVADLKQMLEGGASDPLALRLRDVAARGRTGAVVTQHEISPDLSTVRVESTFWICRAGRWYPATVKQAVVRGDQLGPNAGEALAEDPQVKAIFKVVESLGGGAAVDDLKRQSLSIGAATQKALGRVRTELLTELDALALPVREGQAERKR